MGPFVPAGKEANAQLQAALIEHRQNRVLRRHLSLLDFLVRAASSYARWTPPNATRVQWHTQALQDWYTP